MPWATLNARTFYERKRQLWDVIAESLDRLRTQCELVIIEGAGSPVELNLATSDVVNMAVARLARWRDRLGDLSGQTPVLAGSGSTWFVEGAFEGPDLVVTRTDRP